MSFIIHRCQHIKVNGTQCGSPALKRNRFCFFHKRWHEQRIVIHAAKARHCRPALDLPVLEDANSIQVSIMQIMRLLLHGQLDQKTAGMLLYALQIASSNLRHTSFEETFKTRIVVDPSRVHETELDGDPWNEEDLYDEEDEEEDDDEVAEEAEAKGKAGKQKNKNKNDEEVSDAEIDESGEDGELRDEDEVHENDEVAELQAALQRKPAARHQPSAEAIRSEIRRRLVRMLPATLKHLSETASLPSATAEARSAEWPAAAVPPLIAAQTTPETRQTASKELLHLAQAAGIAAVKPPEKPRVAAEFFSLSRYRD
jgi:hypothetical protein